MENKPEIKPLYERLAIKQRIESLSKTLSNISENAVGWAALLLLNCAFIPNLISVLIGVSDKLPSIDVVLFVWTGLVMLFLQAVIRKHFVNTITIGFGFFIQAILLALIVFK